MSYFCHYITWHRDYDRCQCPGVSARNVMAVGVFFLYFSCSICYNISLFSSLSLFLLLPLFHVIITVFLPLFYTYHTFIYLFLSVLYITLSFSRYHLFSYRFYLLSKSSYSYHLPFTIFIMSFLCPIFFITCHIFTSSSI